LPGPTGYGVHPSVSRWTAGRFLHNIFVEHLWRRLKVECVYVHARETGSEARAGVKKWIGFYGHKNSHSPARRVCQIFECHDAGKPD
jgi:hypothetical protein